MICPWVVDHYTHGCRGAYLEYKASEKRGKNREGVKGGWGGVGWGMEAGVLVCGPQYSMAPL